MERRGFLAGMLALGAAPAILKAANLMPVAPSLWIPPQELTLSEASLEQACIELMNMRDDRGLLLGLQPNNIFLARKLWPGVKVWYQQYYDSLPQEIKYSDF